MKNKVKNNMSNLYKLDGNVSIMTTIPFGFQHICAMFVANVTPVLIITKVAIYNGEPFTPIMVAQLIQSSMLIAGIGTLLQLFPVWKIGSGLPIVMGVSFTFLAACLQAVSKDYGYMIGAVIIGGIVEGILGLTAKYWYKIIQPIVAGCVVMSIGISLFQVGVNSFMSSSVYEAGSYQNLIVAVISLAACLLFQICGKGVIKQLNILMGLIVGYIVSIFCGMVDFSNIVNTIDTLGYFSFPKICSFVPKFDMGIIISFIIVFMVSAVETIGDTSVASESIYGRKVKENEISGSLTVDGFISTLSGAVFGLPAITSFSQNIGLLKVTKVINRFTIMAGAIILMIGGLFPPIGAILFTVPDCVIGGCIVIMFGSIFVAGIEMIAKAGFNKRNMIIMAVSLCIGVGATEVDGFFNELPQFVEDVFASNMVAGVFVIAFILSIVLPKDMD